MKTDKEIESILDKLEQIKNESPDKFAGMSYLDGISDALYWVLGEVDDDEFLE